MKAEVISIGTELLLGEITDLNAAYLASQLPLLGIDLHFISTVGDNKQRLIETLNHAWQRSNIIITTGGLGPTEDDITREAIADFCQEDISIDQSLLEQFRQLFKKFKMEMPDSNIKQASVIPSCQIISNPRGTAPGWWVERDGHIIIAMPGPPSEMQQMWTNVIAPRIREKFNEAVIFSRTIKTFGVSEAKMGELTRSYLLAVNPTVGIYAKPDGIHLRVTAKAASLDEARKLSANTVEEIFKVAGSYIWGTDNDTLEGLISRHFIDNNMTLATMEFNTGGALANTLTNFSDSYKFFRYGEVSNEGNSVLSSSAGNNIEIQNGDISEQSLKGMAEAVRKRHHTTVGIGLVALMESNDSELKPGTVMIGIDNGTKSYFFNRIFPGNRVQIKQRATTSALFELSKIML